MFDFKKQTEYLKNRPLLLHAGAVLLLALFSVATVYYLRVIYSPRWLSQIKGSAVLFAVFTLLYFAFVLRAKLFKDRDEARFMSCILLILGMVFCFATPPNQVPDEQSHYLRGVAMARGQWGFDENYIYPDDVNSLIAHFPVSYNNGYPAKEGNTVYNRFMDYRRAVAAGEKNENSGIIIFQFIPYIPVSAGIFTAGLLGFGALGAYYGGRLANVLFFCTCAYFALKNSGRWRRVVFSLMALPLSCFIWASCNTDSFLFALMFLMISCVMGEDIKRGNAMVFSVCFALLCTCKFSYIVFAPLMLCFDKERWQVKIKGKNVSRLSYAAFTLVLFALVYFGMGLYVSAFSNYGVIERTMANTSPARQLSYVLSYPARYRVVVWDTLKNNSFFLFSGGLLGWLDVNLPVISYLTPGLLVWAAADTAGFVKKGDYKKIAVMFICSILTYAVVITGMYLSWTPVELPQVIGLQMRYMLPAFPGLCMALARLFSRRYRRREVKGSCGLVTAEYIFSLWAAFLMLSVYYLPRMAVVFVA